VGKEDAEEGTENADGAVADELEKLEKGEAEKWENRSGN
jgi:hypothetical protein